MNVYQLTVLNKDKIHIPTIEKFADKFEAVYPHPIETKDGTIFEFEFPTYEHMKKFKDALDSLNPKLFSI